MHAILSKDYIDLKIDTERHLNGEAVAKRLRKERTGGIPWSVITDAEGAELVASDAPGGNIGCPVTEDERAYFIEMVKASRQRITDDELETLSSELAAFAKSIGR